MADIVEIWRNLSAKRRPAAPMYFFITSSTKDGIYDIAPRACKLVFDCIFAFRKCDGWSEKYIRACVEAGRG